MRFELHCHSTCSDGTEPAAEVAARAAARGVAVFALTDHDTCAGSDVTVPGARVLRGVELSCDDGGRTVHVLAFDRGGAWHLLEDRLAAVREARRNRLRVMVARLARRGIAIDVESLLAAADRRSIGRPDLARAMVAAGAASSFSDAFSRHLYDGGPVDVPHQALPLPDALAVGRAAGAAMALAHPHLYDHRSALYLKRHRGDGLTGIEAFYGAYDPRERARWIALADELGATCTGGSDWHGPDASNAPPGVDLPDDRSAALLAWLSG
ncbi:MAG: PHP domain-containing protein [Deltaproteobacteria bacterium]|nr:MAG: PHP domain-containing protein [Deltaproteobacteria bacterium]TMQ28578.1 MAG: PHP domain-containing protein [Deltaproteobacteria bacterium]